MNTLPHYFQKLLSNIEPPEERTKAAQDMPTKVRDYLKENEDIVTVQPHSRLAGSYSRHTAVGDIKDVDILIFLHEDYEDEEPARVLRTLKAVLADLPGCGSIDLRPQRRSIHVYLTDYDFHLDVVPAIAKDGTDKPLVIPDKPQAKWVPSHPLGYGVYLSKMNAEHQNKVVPLIKLLKQWRDVQMKQRRPKSYWLECILVYHIDKSIDTRGKSYAELFAELLGAIYDKFSYTLNNTDKAPRISDPMLGHNVAFNWERSHFETFMRRIDESRRWAYEANDEEEPEDSVKLWRRVFGEAFPETVEKYAQNLAEAIAVCGLFVTSQGRVLTQQTSSGSAIRVPSHRFYGDNES